MQSIGTVDRSYELHVPTRYDEFAGTPVLLDFHGYYGSGENQREESGIVGIADEFNFVVVWPDGLDDTVVPGFDAFSWNAVGTVASPGPDGDTCKWAARGVNNGYPCHASCRPSRGCRNDRNAEGCDCSTCADDVGFIVALLDALEATLCVSTSQVYVTGISNGAMMACVRRRRRHRPTRRRTCASPTGTS